MSPPGTSGRPHRRRIARVVTVVLAVVVLGAVVVGWPLWSARQRWQRLDSAADDFRVPPGFTEVARARQGSGFCWVTCTGGGEAVVTIVLASDAAEPAEACRALRPGVVELAGDAAGAGHLDICGWEGLLGGSVRVFAGAGRATSFSPHDGHRWTDAVAIPDAPVVAFVELSSGLE